MRTCLGQIRGQNSFLNLAKGDFIFLPKNIIQDKSSSINPLAKLKSCVFIGKNVSVEEGVFIQNSIIQSNVKLSKNAQIINSYIGSDQNIGENVIIYNCVLLDYFGG